MQKNLRAEAKASSTRFKRGDFTKGVHQKLSKEKEGPGRRPLYTVKKKKYKLITGCLSKKGRLH